MQEMRIYWRVVIAAVNKLLCHMPSVDLSRDRTALSGKFPKGELKPFKPFVAYAQVEV